MSLWRRDVVSNASNMRPDLAAAAAAAAAAAVINGDRVVLPHLR